MPNDPNERDPIRLLLNTSGKDLIYETPGDAERGNPLDIIDVATAHTCTDIVGVTFAGRKTAKRLAELWNALAGIEDPAAFVAAAESVRADRDVARATIRMAVARLEGIVEGVPTHTGNFLQRIDELRRLEAEVGAL